MPIIVLNDELSVVENKKELNFSSLAEHYPFGIEEETKGSKGIYEDDEDDYIEKKFTSVTDSKVLIASTDEKLIIGAESRNQFLNAVLHAYNNHLSVRFSPDMVLQCVAMAVANCINDHSELYRDVFVNHAGKKKLVVKMSSPPGQFNWTSLLSLMSEEINKNVKSNLGLEPEFSTTTSVSRSVGTLTKMATFKKYFSYGFMLCCGLKSVDLQGTLADWELVRQKVINAKQLITAKGHMVNWFKHLTQVIDNLIETFKGNLSDDLRTFWSRIVTYVPYGSGGQRYISGWIKVLIPGFSYDSFPETLNLLDSNSEIPMKAKYTNIYKWKDDIAKWAGLTFSPPESFTQVPAELNDHGLVFDLYCTAGFLGFNVIDGFAEPTLSYIIHYKPKDKPEVTDEAEKEAGDYTASVVALRGTEKYHEMQTDYRPDVSDKVDPNYVQVDIWRVDSSNLEVTKDKLFVKAETPQYVNNS